MSSRSWMASSESASNQQFLDWRRRVSKNFEPDHIDMAGYALDVHPDLADALVEVSDGLRARMVAAYGVPAMERPDGTIFLFAWGDSLWFRKTEIPNARTIEELGPDLTGVDPYFPPEWSVKLELEDRTKADQRAWMEKLQAYCASAYGAI
jgi:hypothetical protein